MNDPVIVRIKVQTVPTFSNEFRVQNIFTVGDNVRFVALERGMRLEVKDSAGVWQEQHTWSEL